ncbi:MAG TPA: prolyl oligopeptidase family serine peptidase [Caulobacteraceae bacterium]|jgi:prolyl oligopeptidase|nr:prolyl oligopeptidase family serine peptidase [Caulobacteraceae bacterium]
MVAGGSHAQPSSPAAPAAADPFLWLEDVEGARALDWVRAQNARSLAGLEADPRYAGLKAQALAIVNATDRIPMPGLRGGAVYNFWQDKDHVRGLWRRTTLAGYRTASPAWETLLDVDALSAAEKANWVYKGAQCRWPDYRRCLVSLSDGGKDAVQVREFDVASKAFVKDGFALPEGKQDATWLDADTLLVAREWEPGQVTESGYAYIVKRLARGQSLDKAVEVFRGEKTDVGASPAVLHDGDGHQVVVFTRNRTFYESETWIDTPAGPRQLGLPAKHSLQGLSKNQLLFTLEEDWVTPAGVFKSGALVSVDAAEAARSPAALRPRLVVQPGPRQSIEGVTTTKNYVLVDLYENVQGGVRRFSLSGDGWRSETIALPKASSVDVVAAEAESDTIFASVTSFLTPTTLWQGDAARLAAAEVKALPPRFDAAGLVTEQFEATSKDGTKVPYFVVHKTAMKLDGSNPTLLYAYGGFQVSMTPSYSGTTGKLWLENGGVYVLANIRGGGEFGPAWHQAGLKQNRQRIYDDFAAVAEDLIARKITSPRRLGIEGGSNGGLLMGVELVQRPELWNAVVAQVPLLDMLRYHKLLAGASWIAEYGDPDKPDERAFLETISPYRNLKAGPKYPEPFFVTSTKDDRVHPGHARKMAAKMEALGLPFLYYENIDGGHSAAANLQEAARRASLEYMYLTRKLMD